MISREDAAELVGELTNAQSVIRSPRAKASIKRALQIAEAVHSDTVTPPNVVVRSANASFEMTDLIPEILAAQEAEVDSAEHLEQA